MEKLYYDRANNYEKLWLNVRQLEIMFQALVVTLWHVTLKKFSFFLKGAAFYYDIAKNCENYKS